VLKAFDIAPRTVRAGTEVFKGYHRDSFVDSWKSFLPPAVAEPPFPSFEPLHPLQLNIHAVPEHFPNPLQNCDCNAFKNEESAINTRVVTPVTAQKQGEGPMGGTGPSGDAEIEVEL
jgi:hypothetical protein